MGPWASPRRKELRELRDGLEPRLEELKQAVKAEAERRPEAGELMKQKGIGAVIALAYILTIGPVERFPNRRARVRYLGLNPGEHSRGGRQILGPIREQGHEMRRWLLVEAAQSAAQFDPELRRRYQRLKDRRGGPVAKVALARHLAVRFYWTLRTLRQARWATPPVRMPGSPSSPVVDRGPSRV